MTRYLIVNADDFGMSKAVNVGILTGHVEGIVTSASLMVNRPEAEHAVSLARGAPGMSIGLHVDLGEWVYRDGEWVERYRVVLLDDAAAVAAEIERQFDRFRALLGRDPSHLDSHQHVHRQEPARSAMTALARELGVPLREHSAARYEGSFYGQSDHGEPNPDAITVEALSAIIDRLPEGWSELGCHPASAPADDAYGEERPRELEILCDSDVRQQVRSRGVELRTFDDLRAATDV